MEQNQNPHQVWDTIWENYNMYDVSVLEEELLKAKESNTWKKYTEIINSKFGGWKNVTSIELGSGMGGHSLMAASEGATVYLLDYSETALKNAEKRFQLLKLKGNFLHGNAFDLVAFKKVAFNLSWSFGTAEHFSDKVRDDFFNLHFNYIIEKGLTIISTPHKYAINYRIWMHYAKKYKEWEFGLEIPYDKNEYLKKIKKSKNTLVEVFFDEGRPCLNKAVKILKKHSKWRYFTIGLLLRLYLKFKIKVAPFYFRSIILVAEKK